VTLLSRFIQWLQRSPGGSPQPELLDVKWCSAVVVVVAVWWSSSSGVVCCNEGSRSCKSGGVTSVV